MTRRAIFAAVAFLPALAVRALPFSALPLQDSTSSQSQAPSQKTNEQESQAVAPSADQRKKTKKVWTNENLGEVSGSVISQVGEAKDPPSAKNDSAKPPSSQEIAAFRKQLATLQAQLASAEKQITDLKNFSKGQGSGTAGMQLHKGYSTEPIDEQVRKLEARRELLAARVDALFDAARKRGLEPGQLR